MFADYIDVGAAESGSESLSESGSKVSMSFGHEKLDVYGGRVCWLGVPPMESYLIGHDIGVKL